MFRGGRWWGWWPTGWVLLVDPVVCQQWTAPLDLSSSPDLVTYATEALSYSDGQPVTERLSDGWVYLFTLEGQRQLGAPAGEQVTIRRCWLDQGGAIGSCPPEPPAPPPPRGTIGDVTNAPLQNVPPVDQHQHPRGKAGVHAGAQEIARRIVVGFRSELVVRWARNVVKAAGNTLGPRGYPEPDKVVAALFAAWKKEVAFIGDPVNTELMMGAVQLLCLDPSGYCIPAGDCDDQLIGLGSAIMTCGIPVWLRVRWYTGQTQAHVVLLYDSNPRLGGPLKCLDPSLESGVCSDAPYNTEIVIEPDSGEDSGETMFIGIGQAPGDGASGTLGAPPATLPEDQAAAAVAAVDREARALEHAAARLRTSSAAFLAARASANVADQVNASESGGASPLADYFASGSWGPAMADAEAKALQTATFLGSVLADAIAGSRSIVADGGDLAFTTRPGDVFGVLARPDASGELRAWYVDASTSRPVGLIGAAPLARAGTYVTSLWAVVVVRRLLEALARSHAQDSLALDPIAAAGTIGAHFVTPSDVLAYRVAWDPYVMGIARAAQQCAGEWQKLASGSPSTIANVAQFAIPPDATTLKLWADIEGGYVTDITTRWNQWANTPDSTLVLNASDILQDFQETVMKCGQFYAVQIARDCPSITLPDPPSIADQVQVIAHLEGIGALASGLLQILGIGVSGALEGFGDAAKWTQKKVGQIVDTVTSPWLWLTLALAALAAVLYFAPRGLAAGVAAHKAIQPKPAPAPAGERRRRGRPRRARDWPDDHAGHSRAARRGWARRQEKDERVVRNIPSDYEPLWNRVGASFRGTPHERSCSTPKSIPTR